MWHPFPRDHWRKDMTLRSVCVFPSLVQANIGALILFADCQERHPMCNKPAPKVLPVGTDGEKQRPLAARGMATTMAQCDRFSIPSSLWSPDVCHHWVQSRSTVLVSDRCTPATTHNQQTYLKRWRVPYSYNVSRVLIFLIDVTEPKGRYTMQHVIHFCCDIRPMVTFPATEHCNGPFMALISHPPELAEWLATYQDGLNVKYYPFQ